MNHIGVIGMAVMGRNIAQNMVNHGYKVAVFNRTHSVTLEAIEQFNQLEGYESLESFVQSLEVPRKILLMVKAGQPVDAFIDKLIPLLEKGDLIIDGGNSNYQDTIVRHQRVTTLGLNYLGLGVSGGEEGALEGPALMPGGDLDGYHLVEPLLKDIAAVAYGEPCVSYIGNDGAGHYVKMVHNGIEYGDMQLIAEAYHLLKSVGGLSNDELADVFTQWNKGELDSYLIEITSEIFRVKDGDNYLIDMILDKAGQKGTGKWTVEASLDLGVNTSLITSAVYARFISSIKEERVRAQNILPGVDHVVISEKEVFIEKVRRALYLSKIMSYAQGFDLLAKAAIENNWSLSFANIARGFRGGCIIRAKFLNRIAEAYEKNPQLDNLLLDETFVSTIKDYQSDWREIVSIASLNGISLGAHSSALSYYDSYRSGRLPANLIQAQRDYFGAHTFERVDKEGVYHYDWIGQ